MSKALFLVVAICGIFSILYAPWVSGYYRKDGTYVSGYWRTEPNEYKWDNKSFESWDSPYLTDWYNKSWFSSEETYNAIKKIENQQKQWNKRWQKSLKTYDYNWQKPLKTYDYNWNSFGRIKPLKTYDYDWLRW